MTSIGNYDGKVERVLESISAGVGDRVRIDRDNRPSQEGTLMPGDEGGQTDHIVVKLDSGYNVGIEVTEHTSVKSIQNEDD
ncbi:hypothetical protein [Halorubrum sp. Atlit-26R]|mgnify:CR=1 FL=1|uniref:hypothetical protein n=1 Tax=Halorubrum sp. Atlit-26R TaxID=2282128 RepID=UPI000EF1C2AC|nr:hypothetical protein [Halorubrum sp. Atlit-26R]RLM72387.1 hypothetical protein DVK07_07385 [Halorubrum sp. Atlit-26R]